MSHMCIITVKIDDVNSHLGHREANTVKGEFAKTIITDAGNKLPLAKTIPTDCKGALHHTNAVTLRINLGTEFVDP